MKTETAQARAFRLQVRQWKRDAAAVLMHSHCLADGVGCPKYHANAAAEIAERVRLECRAAWVRGHISPNG